jgi:hypothetical protein
MEWLANLSPYFWARIARTLGCGNAPSLRSQCLEAAHVSVAFMARRFAVAKTAPWTLAVGDIDANLTALGEGVEPLDTTAAKIHQLVRLGYARDELIEGVQLIGQIRWSTTVVEQGHGSSAAIHRAHRFYGRAMLTQRSMLCMLRPLFQKVEVGAALAKVARKVERLQSRQPQKVTGRHLFLRDSLREMPDGPPAKRQALGAQIMQAHGARYRQLPRGIQEGYEQEASRWVAEHQRAIFDNIETLVGQSTIVRSRLSDKLLDTAGELHLRDCRFSDADRDAIATLWESEDFTASNVQALRARALLPPLPFDENTRQRLDAMVVDDERPDIAPAWAAAIARKRHGFQGCALTFEHEGNRQVYLFLFAVQRPLTCSLLALDDVPASDQPRSVIATSRERLLHPPFERAFRTKRGQYFQAKDIVVPEDSTIEVLPCCLHVAGNFVVTDAEPVPLTEYLDSIEGQARDTQERPRNATARVAEPNLLARYPWLSQYSTASSGAAGSSSTMEGSADEPNEPEPLDEDEVMRVFTELEAKRLAWNKDHESACDDFKTHVLGGAWTKRHKGVSFDAIRASPSNELAKSWCQRYGLATTSSFALNRYGETVCSALALYWCQRMQYFFDVWIDVEDEDYCFLRSDIDGCPPPRAALLAMDKLPLSDPSHNRLRELTDIAPWKPSGGG